MLFGLLKYIIKMTLGSQHIRTFVFAGHGFLLGRIKEFKIFLTPKISYIGIFQNPYFQIS